MEFRRVLKNMEIPGISLKRSEISTGVFTKKSCGMIRQYSENVWLFGLIYIRHLPIPKMFFKFSKICGAEKWTYLNSSHKFVQCNSFLKCLCDIGLICF